MQIAAEAAVAESLKALDERRQALAAPQGGRRKQPAPPAADADAAAGGARRDRSARPGTSARWSAAAISTRATSTARCRRNGSRARRSSRSSTPPRSKSGYTPATVIDHLNDPIATLQGAWTPEDEHSDAPSMSLRTGLRTSSNRAAVRLLQDVGIPRTVQIRERRWASATCPSVPSLALGSGEVTLQSMTAAYAAFANHGLVPQPILIRRVEDRDGHVLYESQDASTRAISDTDGVSDVDHDGRRHQRRHGVARARQMGFTLPAAGKTGTTNDFNDAWFVGFTPKLVAGVWVGFDQPHTILPNGFAADVAVPLWATFMKAATSGDKPEWFEPPAGITTATVCRLSGKLATEAASTSTWSAMTATIERGRWSTPSTSLAGTEPTEPTAICTRRAASSAKVAGLFGAGQDSRRRRPCQPTGLPPSNRLRRRGPAPAVPAGRPRPNRRRRSAASGRRSSASAKTTTARTSARTRSGRRKRAVSSVIRSVPTCLFVTFSAHRKRTAWSSCSRARSRAIRCRRA